MIAVLGATGNTGRRIVEGLLIRNDKVRGIARSSPRLTALAGKGAEVFVADVADAAALTRAFQGAAAIYALHPTDFACPDIDAHMESVADALARAIIAAGVKHVVDLSGSGAHLPEGPVKGFYAREKRLDAIKGVHVLHLRPNFFMENMLGQIAAIRGMGMIAAPLQPDLPLPWIAAQDIATEAIERLTRLDFTGTSFVELLGQRDITINEATRIIGKAIGRRDLKYVQVPYGDFEAGMLQMEFSPNMARFIGSGFRAYNEGIFRPLELRNARNTTATSFEEWVERVFMDAWRK